MTDIRRFAAAALFLVAAAWGCGGGGAKGGTGGASDGGSDAALDRAGGDARPGDGGGADADGGPAGPRVVQSHSAPIAVNPAGTRLYVVHPDADSVSVLDLATRSILHEVLLAAKPVAVAENAMPRSGVVARPMAAVPDRCCTES